MLTLHPFGQISCPGLSCFCLWSADAVFKITDRHFPCNRVREETAVSPSTTTIMRQPAKNSLRSDILQKHVPAAACEPCFLVLISTQIYHIFRSCLSLYGENPLTGCRKNLILLKNTGMIRFSKPRRFRPAAARIRPAYSPCIQLPQVVSEDFPGYFSTFISG